MVLILTSLNLLPFTLEEVADVHVEGFLVCAFFPDCFSFGFGATFFFSFEVALDGLLAVTTGGVTESELLSLSPSDKFTIFGTKLGSLTAAPTLSLILEDLL